MTCTIKGTTSLHLQLCAMLNIIEIGGTDTQVWEGCFYPGTMRQERNVAPLRQSRGTSKRAT